jgi:hypothetical protein
MARALVTLGVLAATACSSDHPGAAAGPETTMASTAAATPAATPTTSTLAPLDPADRPAIESALQSAPRGCDALDTRQCLLPFPDDHFTVADPTTATGRRVTLLAAGMPVNAKGTPIDPTEWNRNDGFSPNSTLLTYVAGLDGKVGLPPWTDLARSMAPDSSVVLVDSDTAERIPLWAELDAHATKDTDRLLTIHPAVALAEGHHFVVALRGLTRKDGTPVEAGPVFRAYRDRLDTGLADLERHRPEMEATFAALATAGIDRSDLILAWGFTTASERSLSERMLHIRDDALAALGDDAPAFTVTAVRERPTDLVGRQVSGTFTVPSYLTGDGGPGERFELGPDGLPQRNGHVEAPFTCAIPATTLSGTAGPARIAEYGHGLLGAETEVAASNVQLMGEEHNIVFCATKWAGLSIDDVPNAVAALSDISRFPTVADRLQQGVLNQIFLGRLMQRPGGLASHPAFRAGGRPVIDTAHLYFDGNSQGGIMGGMLAAVSPDIERAVLGVPGMNYGLLLPRSVDFDDYEAVFEPAYPSALDRTLILAVLQMLWDRGEAGGYIQHLTKDPYPGTAAKRVLLHVALGDFQVSPLAAEIEARTIGAATHTPIAATGRLKEVTPMWSIPAIDSFLYDGSAIVLWDSGSPDIPLANLPPRAGRDPHGDPRNDPVARQQKSQFLQVDGRVADVCRGDPCRAAPA